MTYGASTLIQQVVCMASVWAFVSKRSCPTCESVGGYVLFSNLKNSSRSPPSLVPTLTGHFIAITTMPVATVSNQKSIDPISRTAISTSPKCHASITKCTIQLVHNCSTNSIVHAACSASIVHKHTQHNSHCVLCCC